MQTPLLGFLQPRAGLFTPAPAGLSGFTRQGMDARKKDNVLPFVGVASVVGVNAALPLPPGTRIGDLLIYSGNAASSPAVPSNSGSWNTLTGVPTDAGGNYLWKLCENSDFSATIGTGSTPTAVVWAFRGYASAVYATGLGDSTGSGTFGTTFSLSGFVKHAKTRALLIFSVANSAAARSITAPAALVTSFGFNYLPVDQTPIPGTGYRRWGAYTLNANAYVNNAGFTLQIPATWDQASTAVIELRVA